MENTDKLQNKCALPGNKFRDGQNLHEENLSAGMLQGIKPGRVFDGSLLTSSGKSGKMTLY